MLHRNRIWNLIEIGSRPELAHKLSQFTWPECQAMSLQGYVFANDSTSPDGAQEYAILKPHADGEMLVQIESITFSWCTEERALELITQVCSGQFDEFEHVCVGRHSFQTPVEHGLCRHCQ